MAEPRGLGDTAIHGQPEHRLPRFQVGEPGGSAADAAAFQRRARALWIANVGDIKPMEYPLSFFMRMAWNPEVMTPEAVSAFPRRWASETFGSELARRSPRP